MGEMKGVSTFHNRKIPPPPKKKSRGRAKVLNILDVSCLCEELNSIVNKGSTITAV